MLEREGPRVREGRESQSGEGSHVQVLTRARGRILGMFVMGFAVAVLVAGCSSRPTAPAGTVGALTVEDIYARPAPAGGIGGAFLTVRNSGSIADRLIGVRTPVAQAVELHETIEENGVMKMRPVPGGFEVPPDGTLALGPGGGHMMFVGLSSPLKAGESVEITLTFEKAGEITLKAPIHP